MELDGGSDSDNSDNIYGKTNFVEKTARSTLSRTSILGSSSRRKD